MKNWPESKTGESRLRRPRLEGPYAGKGITAGAPRNEC